jgi:hypothetical protein
MQEKVFFFFCNLFIFKEEQRQMQIQQKPYDMHIQFYRQKTFNLSKQTFCNTELKFQTPRTVSNGNHCLHLYFFCVGDRKCMIVFSILIQYFRPPLILGLSPKHLHLYK